MTPRALFDLPAVETSNDLDCLRGLGYDFLPELGDRFVSSTPRVRVDLLHQHDYDHRRFWRLMTVRIDDQPVMILQNSGREGSDFSRRLIVDHRMFTLLLAHLNYRGMGPVAAAAVAEEARAEVIAMDDDLPDVTQCPGCMFEKGEFKAE